MKNEKYPGLWFSILITFLMFALTALIAIPNARAESKKGYDAIGLAMYCNVYLKAPHLPALSTLMNTFGNPLNCIEKKQKKKPLDIVQVDLVDATCWRGNKCPPGAPKPTDTKIIKARAMEVNVVAKKWPQTEWWVSPALEHDVKDPNDVKKMLEAAAAGCPVCKVINSPFTGARPAGYPVELHGTTVKSFSVSGDGQSSYDADNIYDDGNGFEHINAGGYTTYEWWNELNLRCSGEKDFVPPLKRTEKPTADQFMQAWLIAQPQQAYPPIPPQCKKIQALGKGEIYKPNAESYCNGQANSDDVRSNKPLFILDKKTVKTGGKLSVLNATGKEVACFRYYGQFQGSLHRWYMGSCSGHHPAELYKALGGEWGYVPIGAGNCLRTNSIRRLGVYR